MSTREEAIDAETGYIVNMFMFAPDLRPDKVERIRARVAAAYDHGRDELRAAVVAGAERCLKAEAEVDDLEAAIERVQELHSPTTDGSRLCAGCMEVAGFEEMPPSWESCPTLKALRGPEGE